jgi:hypothetical protein
MTKIKNNALLQALSGKMGETHVYRKVRGKMQMVNRPATGGPKSDRQKVFNARFLKAANYAKAQMKDDTFKSLYQSGVTDKKINAYIVAVSDALNAPVVNEIKAVDYKGAVGNVITIDAIDDFKVVRVRVIILGNDGHELERGEATQDPKQTHIWRYTATAANLSVTGSTISVTAFDLPDNETTLEKVL